MDPIRNSRDEEKAHLEAIVINRRDPAPRLAYADWLDMQGRENDANRQRVLADFKPPPMRRIATFDPAAGSRGSTSAHVVSARNHLLQMRSFAFDGRDWFYAPDNRSAFQRVTTSEVPDHAVGTMAIHTGLPEEFLKGQLFQDDFRG